MHISPHGLKWNVLLQVMDIIILGRLAQFHSDNNFDVSCFNEHKIRLKHENWVNVWRHALSSGDVGNTFQSKGSLWLVMLLRWCVKNFIWNITLEWPQVNEWKSPCLNIGIAVHRLSTQWAMPWFQKTYTWTFSFIDLRSFQGDISYEIFHTSSQYHHQS